MSVVSRVVETVIGGFGAAALVLGALGTTHHVNSEQVLAAWCLGAAVALWLFYFVLHPFYVWVEDRLATPARARARAARTAPPPRVRRSRAHGAPRQRAVEAPEPRRRHAPRTGTAGRPQADSGPAVAPSAPAGGPARRSAANDSPRPSGRAGGDRAALALPSGSPAQRAPARRTPEAAAPEPAPQAPPARPAAPAASPPPVASPTVIVRGQATRRTREPGASRPIHVEYAHYGAGGAWDDVTEVVGGYVRGGVLEMPVTAEVLGDPAPGVAKSLVILYTDDHGAMVGMTFLDGQTARLPAG